jgi:hypothetical protein
MEHKFVRDSTSKALINTDDVAIQARRIRKQDIQKFADLEKEILEVRRDMQELKQMIRDILNS